MTKEHKKLYKAGKNWIVATLTATTITLLGGIGAYTVHADTTLESSQDVQTTSVNQTNQVDNSNDSVTINQPVTTQSYTTVQSKQPVQGNQTAQDNQNTSATIAAVTDVNNDGGLDPNIYGTVNVKDWDYQENNNIFNLTGYHGAYNHIVLPNLNDFNNAGVNVNGATGVGITSNVLHGILCDAKNPDADLNLAISKTTGIYNDKVIAENENWAGVFCPYNLTYENGKPVLSGTNQFTLVNADLSNLDTNKVTNIAFLFDNQHKLQTVSGLNSWKTSNITDMSCVFGACWALNNVGDLSSWDTSNVTNMNGMFGASGLSDLTMIKDWNTSNVTDMSYLFRSMENLKSLDITGWDTHSVTNMQDMFDSLHMSSIDLSKLNTSKVTDMSSMFFGTRVANIKGFENWDTSNVRTMKEMFKYSEVENLLSISNWDTSKVEDMSSMFMGTQNLKQLDLTKWDCSSLTNVGTSYRDAMFGDSNLSFYIVLNRSKNNPNEITLYDPYGLMGNEDTIIAKIKAPTFYQQVAGKSENDIIIETITPIVEAYAKNEYTNFYMHLNPGMKEIYPTSANIKLASYVDPSNPYSAVNCQFNYTTKIGELKDAVINYYDQDRNLIKTDHFIGLIGKTRQVPYTMPDGYMLLDGEQIPKSITLKEGKLQSIDVYLKKVPVTKQVVVNYVDVNGQTVKSNSLSGNIGETISLNLSLPEGYELVDGQSIPSSITLKENENQTITVKVTKAPAVKTGSINYVDQDGKVIKTDTISGKVGDQITIKVSLPDGYELANKDEQIPSSITVGEDGIKTITIQVKKLPVVQTGSINYVDQDGKVIKTDTISGKVGDQINVTLSLPDGYELANTDEQIPSTVTVTEDGISPISVNIKKINTTPTTPVNPTEPNNPTNPAQPSNPTTLPTGQPGWSQQNGNWYYFNNQGSASTGWQKLNNWYYFDPNNGQMLSGLQSINNKYYYLNQNHDGTFGAMQTGWQWINGNWYGLKGDGSAYLGWQKLNGRWYYFDDENANALTGWQKLNGRWYYFDPTNAWAQTGWFKSGAGYWYYFDPTNAWALTNWAKLNNHWYYFDNTNANALTGWQSINSHWYYFDPTNAWALTGWQYINGHWYWFDSVNAWAKTGWQWYNGNWYFMDQQNAWMMTGWATNTTNDQLYYLDQNGHPVTGWQRDSHGFWYYLQPSDAAAIGWNWINGYWYYFNPEETINGIKAKGAMFTGRHFIDNRWNRFDLNGHWLGYEN